MTVRSLLSRWGFPGSRSLWRRSQENELGIILLCFFKHLLLKWKLQSKLI